MAQHAAHATRSPWRPLVLAVVAGLALVSSAGGVFALLRATATATQTATSGTLLMTAAANGTFGTSISGAAPGDLVHRFLTLSNTGTLAGDKLVASVAATAPNELSNGSVSALRITIAECSVAWNPAGTVVINNVTVAEGTCSGSASGTAVSSTAVPFTNVALVSGTIPALTGKRHLRISFRVPDNSEVSTDGVAPAVTVQGKSTTLTFTFTEDQRTGTVTAS